MPLTEQYPDKSEHWRVGKVYIRGYNGQDDIWCDECPVTIPNCRQSISFSMADFGHVTIRPNESAEAVRLQAAEDREREPQDIKLMVVDG